MDKQSRTSYIFEEFFASGKEETLSPFLTPGSRRWGFNLPLKTSILAAACLVLGFCFRFVQQDLSHLFLLLVYVLSGTPALISTLEDLKRKEINIDVLMTMAALLSILIGNGFEGALLLVLFELSASMETAVIQKTKSTLASLHTLSPTKAWLIAEDGHLFERSIKDILIGTKILVKAGEIAPLDGVILEGTSFITLSHLTGESIPVAKTVGEQIPAGAKNLDGSLIIQVLRQEQESTLSKIIDLVTKAQHAKPGLQKWLDRFSQRYATSIILLTAFFALSLPLFISHLPYIGVEGSIYRALTFLVAASPCALIIGAPTAYLSALSSCAKRGVLLKGGSILDSLSQCKKVAFDKTGTLTTGNLRCTKISPLTPSSYSTDEALSIAASMERHVKHPIGEAILSLAKQKNLVLDPIEELRSIPGSGMEAIYSSKKEPCFLGSKTFISSKTAFPIPDPDVHIGGTQTYLLIGSSLFLFLFEDEVRKEALPLIERLKRDLSMELLLLTGDEERNGLLLAKELGIDTVYAKLSPADKLDKVSTFAQSQDLIMIGDGVNDAPALARATVGISMGKIGSSCAIEASDVVFLQDDLSHLDWLMRKSRQTTRIIKQNLTLALCVILLATTPALLGFVPLWLAVILHEGGTLLVGLNSLRLLKQ